MNRRSMLLATAVAAVSAALCYWLLAPAPPKWIGVLGDPFWRAAEGTPPALTDHDAAVCRRLQNDLLLRPLWTIAEVEEIERIIVAGYTRPISQKNRTKEEVSAHLAFHSAYLCVWARLGEGAPMTPEARRRIVEIMRQELYQQFPERRSDGAAALIETGQIESPEIRAEVERLLKDEDNEVAEYVHRRLAEYDRLKARKKILEERGGGT